MRMKFLAVVYLFSSLFLFDISGVGKTEDKHPNVLMIAVDDLNDWIGMLGGNIQVKTPNLDRLAKRGMYFTNAHCSAPVCNTSRHSLLSGLYPANTGWYGSINTSKIADSYEDVLNGRVPMPTHFKNNGYLTLAAGKIFHKGVQDFEYPYWDITRPAKYGFSKDSYNRSKFAPFPKDGGFFNHKYPQKISGKTLCWAALEDDEIPHDGMPDEQIAKWAAEQLENDFSKPFFMAIGFLRPHVPFTAPKEYFELYSEEDIRLPEIPDNEFSDIPIFGKAMAYGTLPEGDHKEVIDASPTYWRELVRAYLACISFVDAQIGRVLDALDSSEYGDNTIVVLWSDHGQHLGEKKHWRKQCLWEESTRVPLFISTPSTLSKGVTSNVPVSLLDLFPTLTTLCKLPEQELDGVDISPLLDDPNAKRGRPVLTNRYYGNHSVRSEHWRYIRYRDGSEELYDHRVDPGEHKNLVGDPRYAGILDLQRQYLPSNDVLPAGSKELSDDKYDHLVRKFKANGIPEWLK